MTNKTSPDRYWACWSHSQQAFHVEDEAEGVETNMEAFKRGSPMDYIVIGVFDDRKLASKFLDSIEHHRKA